MREIIVNEVNDKRPERSRSLRRRRRSSGARGGFCSLPDKQPRQRGQHPAFLQGRKVGSLDIACQNMISMLVYLQTYFSEVYYEHCNR